jgi:drug/metabolite transporter (DMT)-like permease
MTAATERRHAASAILMIVLSALCLSMMDAATKYLSGFLSAAFVLWARYTIQAIIMAACIWKTRGRSGFRTVHPRYQALRGTLLVTASGLAFYGLRYMPLAEFTAILMLSPIVVTAAASLMSQHRIGGLRWLLVWGGFIGTLIVIRPGSGAFGLVAVVPLCGMIATSMYSLLTSRLAMLEHPYTTQFYSGVTGSVLAAGLMALQGNGAAGGMPDAALLPVLLLLLIGTFSAIGHLLLVMAFSRAAAASLMPFTYAQIGFAAILSWLVFRHAPDFWAWIGMITIAVCGAATAWINIRARRGVTRPSMAEALKESEQIGQ